MNRFINSFKNDIKIQFKYGFYTVYLIVTVIYIIILKNIQEEFVSKTLTFIIFSDPSFLGFLFIGAIILFEKSENTIDFLTATPLRIHEYILSKVLSLSFLSFIASLVIIFAVVGIKFNFFILLIAIILTSSFFTLLGIFAVSKMNNINEYLIWSVFYLSIFSIPVISFFEIFNSSIFFLIPTHSSLNLFSMLFSETSLIKAIISIFLLIIFNLLIYYFTYKRFYKYVLLKAGG